ncbi:MULTISPECIES: ABC transporter permease [unclassified Neptuniibacter]|jgi:NitT/TauT family transport system permease protein|uniref:ABC transporter permease n=1 Tax=unclassified Neptuniibacter TaxID=2630693 RepID=UPI0026E1A245|nr:MULTISPECIES: ABC transporter permease [unclassified Neptuniibacter]MDO6515394.1 ABC transporter permease [Neptuniibacter sp. 2_MG-2023]MDO6594720.1 ABC transporter permease [Neptuniibacter sp. 1_MG-2023]
MRHSHSRTFQGRDLEKLKTESETESNQTSKVKVMSLSLLRWLIPLGVILLGWQCTALFLASDNVPSVVQVFSSLQSHLVNGDMLYHLMVTLYRVALSFCIAMFFGVMIGIVMGAFPRLNEAGDSLLVIALNVPALVTIILCYVWFGLVEAAAITAVAINKIPTVIVMVREGARVVDRDLLQVAQVFKVSPFRCFFKVYLPQLYPFIMASARSGLSLIWKVVLVVELLGRSDGVGFQLGTFFHFFDIASILAYTLAFAAIILVIEGLLMRPLDRYIARGNYNDSGAGDNGRYKGGL